MKHPYDKIYNILPTPLRFACSLLFHKRQFTPFQSNSTHLKAASERLYHHLIDLQKECCALSAFDFGNILTKVAIFIPTSVRFSVPALYDPFVLNHLSYSAVPLGGSFIFLRF